MSPNLVCLNPFYDNYGPDFVLFVCDRLPKMSRDYKSQLTNPILDSNNHGTYELIGYSYMTL